MRDFQYAGARSFEEAAAVIVQGGGRAEPMGGGTDLLGVLKSEILPNAPEVLVNLKTIPGYGRIERIRGALTLGAGARLDKIAELSDWPALAAAARSVASPLIRPLATVGGNILQDVRCWYYRYPDEIGGRLVCHRKGGEECYAVRGENRHHSVFGGLRLRRPPCSAACPAGTDVPSYMALMRLGDPEGAARIAMSRNPMPAVTSRVCAHFCEGECNRRTTDQAVSVHEVERRLGDLIMGDPGRYYPPPEAETGKSVAVVGSGPAGLTAAYHLRRAGHSVTVYERMEKAGGCLRYAIPEYRLPRRIVDGLVDALSSMGIAFRTGAAVGPELPPGEIEARHDKTFYATGAWKRPVLGFDGEELTEFGLDFLTEVNTWVAKKDRDDVLVVGGGNVAMDVAVTVGRLGARRVSLACLEGRGEMPASAEEIRRAEDEGVSIMNGWGVSKVISEGGRVKGMELVKCLRVFDGSGRFNPVYDRSVTKIAAADSILLAAGQAADLDFLGDGHLKRTGRGLIEIDEATGRTSRGGVYAGGDAATGPATVIKAVAAGLAAARAINRELGGPAEEPGGSEASKAGAAPKGSAADSAVGTTRRFLSFSREGILERTPCRGAEAPVPERRLDREDSATIGGDEALREAGRCLNCSCYSVNPSDMANVLVMMDATIVTTRREIGAEELLCSNLRPSDGLAPGELVKEIRIPEAKGVDSYDKNRVRDAIDFAHVALASRFVVEDGVIRVARIVFGAVAPVPLRMRKVEEFLAGRAPDAETAELAAEKCVAGAVPMASNEPKLFVMRALLKRAVLRVA